MRHDEDADAMGAGADAALAFRQHRAPPRRAGRPLLPGIDRPRPGCRRAIATRPSPRRFPAAGPPPPGVAPRPGRFRAVFAPFPTPSRPSPTLITVARGVVV